MAQLGTGIEDMALPLCRNLALGSANIIYAAGKYSGKLALMTGKACFSCAEFCLHYPHLVAGGVIASSVTFAAYRAYLKKNMIEGEILKADSNMQRMREQSSDREQSLDVHREVSLQDQEKTRRFLQNLSEDAAIIRYQTELLKEVAQANKAVVEKLKEEELFMSDEIRHLDNAIDSFGQDVAGAFRGVNEYFERQIKQHPSVVKQFEPEVNKLLNQAQQLQGDLSALQIMFQQDSISDTGWSSEEIELYKNRAEQSNILIDATSAVLDQNSALLDTILKRVTDTPESMARTQPDLFEVEGDSSGSKKRRMIQY